MSKETPLVGRQPITHPTCLSLRTTFPFEVRVCTTYMGDYLKVLSVYNVEVEIGGVTEDADRISWNLQH